MHMAADFSLAHLRGIVSGNLKRCASKTEISRDVTSHNDLRAGELS